MVTTDTIVIIVVANIIIISTVIIARWIRKRPIIPESVRKKDDANG
jgi:hypothetical protein